MKVAYIRWKDAVAEEASDSAAARLHIPRVSIQEMRVVDLDKLLPKRKRKAAAGG